MSLDFLLYAFFAVFVLLYHNLKISAIQCYKCVAESDSCFDDKCRGTACFKAQGKLNDKLLVEKGCVEGNSTIIGCKQKRYVYKGGIGQVNSRVCHCNDKNFCNVASKTKNSLIVLWLYIVSAAALITQAIQF